MTRSDCGADDSEQPDCCRFFAYGSLMWKPGFAHQRMRRATLHGWSRSLCIYSWVWRGTRERPGLVMGLAPGGLCHGLVIEAPSQQETEILAYLDERELVTDVYERRNLPVKLDDGSTALAWSYVAKPDHEQFAQDLKLDAMISQVVQGHGRGGSNIDYVLATTAHLAELEIDEPALMALAEHLQKIR